MLLRLLFEGIWVGGDGRELVSEDAIFVDFLALPSISVAH